MKQRIIVPIAILYFVIISCSIMPITLKGETKSSPTSNFTAIPATITETEVPKTTSIPTATDSWQDYSPDNHWKMNDNSANQDIYCIAYTLNTCKSWKYRDTDMAAIVYKNTIAFIVHTYDIKGNGNDELNALIKAAELFGVPHEVAMAALNLTDPYFGKVQHLLNWYYKVNITGAGEVIFSRDSMQ